MTKLFPDETCAVCNAPLVAPAVLPHAFARDRPADYVCLRCGLADLGDARFVECEACAAKPPFNNRQVFVALHQRRTKSKRITGRSRQ